jgi:hypothetical protein
MTKKLYIKNSDCKLWKNLKYQNKSVKIQQKSFVKNLYIKSKLKRYNKKSLLKFIQPHQWCNG